MRSSFSLGLGVLQVGIGAYIALRPLIPPHTALTGARWLDAAFAFFFILRGVMNVRSALRARSTGVR